MLHGTSADPDLLERLLLLVPGPGANFIFTSITEALAHVVRNDGTRIQARLEPFLVHEDPYVRLAAAVTTASCCEQTDAVNAAILDFLETPPTIFKVRIDLTDFKGDKRIFIPPLVKYLDSPDFDFVEVAGQALASMGKEGLPPILAAIASDKPNLRRNGLLTLAAYAVQGVQRGRLETWLEFQPGLLPMARNQPDFLLEMLGLFPDRLKDVPQESAELLHAWAEANPQRVRPAAASILKALPPRQPKAL